MGRRSRYLGPAQAEIIGALVHEGPCGLERDWLTAAQVAAILNRDDVDRIYVVLVRMLGTFVERRGDRPRKAVYEWRCTTHGLRSWWGDA